ncbi:hypothetical protein FQR65_LT05344 [Abscondita terminalis]|nr:hypothetical protein FQR65_LT05344 [Abscondita terminalis]
MTRLHPDTTKESEFLMLNKIFIADCEQMESKYPNSYSSFKVAVAATTQLDAVCDCKIWPPGVIIVRKMKFYGTEIIYRTQIVTKETCSKSHKIQENTSGRIVFKMENDAVFPIGAGFN